MAAAKGSEQETERELELHFELNDPLYTNYLANLLVQ
jgi:hypothetical protein